jgi:hypothetical protein
MPPFEQLEQRNRAIRNNLGLAEPSSLYQQLVVDPPSSIANIWANTLDFGSSLNPEDTFIISNSSGSRRRNLYPEWTRKNSEASPQHLNSNYYYFQHQSKCSKSLEILLLEAIANNKEFKTKTTWYRPHSKEIWFLNNPIAWLDKDYQIRKVRLPELKTKENADLFRHRLRQLGLKCLATKRGTVLHLPQGYVVPLIVNETVYIPAGSRKCCLPIFWKSKAILEIPNQAQLPLNHQLLWEDLPGYRESSALGVVTARIALIDKNIQVEVDLYDSNGNYSSKKELLPIKTRDSVISQAIKTCKDALLQQANLERLKKTKFSWSDYNYQGYLRTGTTTTTTITTASTSPYNTYTITGNLDGLWLTGSNDISRITTTG